LTIAVVERICRETDRALLLQVERGFSDGQLKFEDTNYARQPC